MRSWQQETLRIPTRHACPMCRDMAESYGRYEESRLKDELHDRLRDGSAPVRERIKAAWELHGSRIGWEHGGPIVHVPEPIYNIRFVEPEEPIAAVKYDTFQFERSITRNSWGTVTRIHCQGITVSETTEETN